MNYEGEEENNTGILGFCILIFLIIAVTVVYGLYAGQSDGHQIFNKTINLSYDQPMAGFTIDTMLVDDTNKAYILGLGGNILNRIHCICILQPFHQLRSLYYSMIYKYIFLS